MGWLLETALGRLQGRLLEGLIGLQTSEPNADFTSRRKWTNFKVQSKEDLHRHFVTEDLEVVEPWVGSQKLPLDVLQAFSLKVRLAFKVSCPRRFLPAS